jgi:hypothetical protein
VVQMYMNHINIIVGHLYRHGHYTIYVTNITHAWINKCLYYLDIYFVNKNQDNINIEI